MKRLLLFAVGGLVAAYVIQNRQELQTRVRDGARRIRNELDGLEQQVLGGLDKLARRIDEVNSRLTELARTGEQVLDKIAS